MALIGPRQVGKTTLAQDIAAERDALYLDLEDSDDRLLVRRLPPLQANIGKRLVKSPKVYVRDSGLVHALLGIADYNDLAGHPVVGASWEGFVIEDLLAVAPDRTQASYFRTAAGAEIDLVLELPGGSGRWAIEIKRALTARPAKGFCQACEDIQPARSFVVCAGTERCPISEDVQAVGVLELAQALVDLG